MRRYSINCNGRLLTFEQAKIMGVLNITTDSYYAASRANKDVEILRKASALLENGADLLDIGGVSTRPGATPVELEEELQKTAHAIQLLRNEFPEAIISLDTFRGKPAAVGLEEGADLINDISAYQFDSSMAATLQKYQCPYILSYSNTSFEQMHTPYAGKDLIGNHLTFLARKQQELKSWGLNDIICDPGFGFGKSLEQNWELMKNLSAFEMLDSPLMIGISRKSMLYKTWNSSPEEMLAATSALHFFALQNGAHLLRVHDPKEAVQVREMLALLEG